MAKNIILEQQVKLIAESLNLDLDLIINPTSRVLPKLTLGNVIENLLQGSVEEYATRLRLSSSEGLKKSLRIFFTGKLPVNGRRGNYTYSLLALAQLKRCSYCNLVYFNTEFHKASSSSDGFNHSCKDCTHIKSTSTTAKEYSRKHYAENKDYYKARNATQRDRLKIATPKWADLNKIEEIYLNCPKGYHVDHIIPLKGELVCGLHVENNLQYLTAEDNLKKSNKFEI